MFDGIAEKLAPGFSPLDYRWVALGVRKAAGRYAAKAQAIKLPNFEFLGQTDAVRASRITTGQGIYLFRCEDDSLFIGDTDNLRQRIERHFDTGGASVLPDWLYDRRGRVIGLGILPTPKIGPTERKIVELGAVNAFRPFFNYGGGRAA